MKAQHRTIRSQFLEQGGLREDRFRVEEIGYGEAASLGGGVDGADRLFAEGPVRRTTGAFARNGLDIHGQDERDIGLRHCC